MKRYLTAREATEILGISAATLYAYVSRGLIRSETAENDNRSRRYSAEDVEKLRDRKEGRKKPETLVRSSLHWGTPILESALTLITEKTIYYRGYDVQALSRRRTPEQVAALLWIGQFEDAARLFDQDSIRLAADLAAVEPPEAAKRFVSRLHCALALAEEADYSAYDFQSGAVARTGARIMRLMTNVLTGQSGPRAATDQPDRSLAGNLAAQWCPNAPQGKELIGTALILCADHELNASSFAARVAASAGATPYGAVMAGLATLQGIHHGGMTEQVEEMLRDLGREGASVQSLLRLRVRRGEGIPGFGHRLYPDGDPRYQCLRERLGALMPASPTLLLGDSIAESVWEMIGELPTIDFGLAMLVIALDLPPGAGLALFCLGRTMGWIAHAIEQYRQGQLVRPRATYTGPGPRPLEVD